MDKNNFLKFITDERFIKSVIFVVIIIVIYKLSRKVIDLRINRIKSKEIKDGRKKRTYLKVFDSCLKYICILICFVIVLKIYGINVSTLFAGLGIVSVITGLALQDALKDIIAGFNIVVDGYFSVGDVLKIDDVEGKVFEIKLKVTKLKDINNGNILVIANRNIIKALNISNQLDIDIPIPYEEKAERIERVLDDVIQIVEKMENLEEIKYVGINEFANSAVMYKLRLWCKPEYKPQIKRDVLKIIKLKLDQNNICIPYTQIDIHTK